MKRKATIVILLLILALGLRLFRIDEYMTFLGDEGRDALVVRDILVNHHLPLLGPPTSVGSMYLGPLYYYMMASAMSIWWLNPIAAAVMVALIGVATVGLVFYLTNRFYGFWPGFIAALLYATSPITIYYSRSSWNPNPLPFFTLFTLIGFLKAKTTNNYLWLILSGVALAFAVQMHYLALLLLPTFGIIWMYLLLKVKDKRNFRNGSLLAVLVFLFLMSPVAIFDLRHDFMNYHALKSFFWGHNSSLNGSLVDITSRVWAIFNYNLVGRYLSLENPWLYSLASLLLLTALGRWFVRCKDENEVWFFHFMLVVWLLVGVLGLAILREPVYDHYLGFLNPAPFILLAGLGLFLPTHLLHKRLGLFVTLVISAAILIGSLLNNPFRYEPNRQLQRTQAVAGFIIENSQNQPFNFALIAQNNYDAAYQFYLGFFGHQPKQLPFEKTQQLFVVCEDAICNPVGHAKYEVAAFGMAKIEKVYQLMGVKIYKLVPNPTGTPS